MPLPNDSQLGLASRVVTGKAVWASMVAKLRAWFDTFPDTLTSYGRAIIAVASDGSGLKPVSVTDTPSFSAAVVDNYRRKTVTETAASRTINAASSDVTSGTHLVCNRSSAQTITLADDLPVGWEITWSQWGTGQVTFAVSGSGSPSLRNYLNHTKSVGRFAAGGLRVVTNSGGVFEVSLYGQTAA